MLRVIIRLGYIAIVFIEALIMTRIVLIVINANLENAFASWIMDTSILFIQPFEGIVSNAVQINNFTMDLTPLVALLFYIIGAFILSELLKSFSRE